MLDFQLPCYLRLILWFVCTFQIKHSLCDPAFLDFPWEKNSKKITISSFFSPWNYGEDLLDSYIFATITQWDTIISSSNVCVKNLHICGSSNVDPVGVGAIFWCTNFKPIKCEIVAPQNIHMKVFAILGSNVTDNWIIEEIKTEILLRFVK